MRIRTITSKRNGTEFSHALKKHEKLRRRLMARALRRMEKTAFTTADFLWLAQHWLGAHDVAEACRCLELGEAHAATADDWLDLSLRWRRMKMVEHHRVKQDQCLAKHRECAKVNKCEAQDAVGEKQNPTKRVRWMMGPSWAESSGSEEGGKQPPTGLEWAEMF